MGLSYPLTLGTGAALGVLVHCTVFKRGEWHVQAPKIAVAHAWFLTILTFAQIYYRDTILGFHFRCMSTILVGYVIGLFASIVVYRVWFHQLTRAGFIGPTSACISKLWHVWACRGSKNYLVLDSLHKKYGDFVRIGPSEISVIHPEVFWAVDGPRTECIKAEWYDILHPSLALVTARVKSIHAARRRQWNRGFTAKALVLHEQKVVKYIDKLEECITNDAQGHKVSQVRDLFYWLGFDFMGEFVFNKSFGMLETQKWHHIIVRLQRALSLLGPFSPAPWLIQVGFKLAPRIHVLKDWFEMVAWCENQMRERIQVADTGDFTPDLTHYLMEKSGTHDMEDESWFWLKGDSLLAIVAGSEPTASALIALFNELARAPKHADKIFDEIEGLDLSDARPLEQLSHLNGAINEAVRLYPALFTGGARKTTTAITIGDVSIPPNTTIVAPRYSISRREDCFVRADEFLPERWSTQPELVLNPSAFAPFGTGHHSCLGRFLATDIMRLVTARIIRRFRFKFAPGEDGSRVMGDLADQFTANPGGLSLVFEIR